MIRLFKPFVCSEAANAVKEVLKSGQLTQGAIVDKFEERLKEVTGSPNICTVNSGTSGLHLALSIIKEEIEREEKGADIHVLTTPLTCAATNLPIIHNGMKIRWYDLCRNFDNFNLDDILSKLTEKTRVLMLVSWGGSSIHRGNMVWLRKYYEKTFNRELFVVEDRAHCIVGGQAINPESFTVYSFQAIKHLTTVDGGLLIPPAKFLKKARLMRWFGLDRDNNASFRSSGDISLAGYKFHMNNLNAAIGLSNLNSNEYIENLSKNCNNLFYLSRHIKNNEVELITDSTWLATLIVKNRGSYFKGWMDKYGIEVNQIHTRNDKYSVFSKFQEELPNMDYYEDKYFCVPFGWWLDRADLDKVVEAVNAF